MNYQPPLESASLRSLKCKFLLCFQEAKLLTKKHVIPKTLLACLCYIKGFKSKENEIRDMNYE
jgi:hypothetical protein